MRGVTMRPFSDDEIETVRTMIAAGHTARDVADRLGRTRNSVIALSNRKQLGPWKFSNGKTVDGVKWMPVPNTPRERARPVSTPDVETIRNLIAERKSAAEIAVIVGRTIRSVKHIVAYRGMGPFLKRSNSAPADTDIPDDFAERWAVMTQRELSLHYHRRQETVRAWINKSGLVRTAADRAAVARAAMRRISTPSISYTPRTVSRIPGHKPAPFGNAFRDPTTAGQAADTLRKDGWKVHRCNAAGIYDPAGSLWQCGRVRCTEAELIERAERVRARHSERKAA